MEACRCLIPVLQIRGMMTGYQTALINGHVVRVTDDEAKSIRTRPYDDENADMTIIEAISRRIATDTEETQS